MLLPMEFMRNRYRYRYRYRWLVLPAIPAPPVPVPVPVPVRVSSMTLTVIGTGTGTGIKYRTKYVVRCRLWSNIRVRRRETRPCSIQRACVLPALACVQLSSPCFSTLMAPEGASRMEAPGVERRITTESDLSDAPTVVTTPSPKPVRHHSLSSDVKTVMQKLKAERRHIVQTSPRVLLTRRLALEMAERLSHESYHDVCSRSVP